jgi:hypothetical protein
VKRAGSVLSTIAARALVAILTFALLVGSMPLTTGVTFIRVSDRPIVSLDLCQPLHAAAVATVGVIARPASIHFESRLSEIAVAILERTLLSCHLSDAPESPPPEATV